MQKRKASINIQKAGIGEFWHNTREKSTKNSIFPENKNEYDNDAKKGIELYKKDLEEKARKYTERTGQKLQKNAITLMNAVVNLNENHSLNDLKKVARMLEQKLDVKVYQVAVHRDEGYVDETGKKHINWHGHILFSGLDSEGRAVKRNKLNIHTLQELQTEVANILGMERGQPNKEKRKHLDIYTYKQVKKAESELIKQINRGVKLSDKKINRYLSYLEKKFEDVKGFTGKIKINDAIDILKDFFHKIKLQTEKLEKENSELKEKLNQKNFQLQEVKVDLEKSREENKQLFKQIEKYHNTIKKMENTDTVKLLKENSELKKENSELKLTVKSLKNELSELRKKMISLNKENENKIFDKDDYQYISRLKRELRADTVKQVYEKIKDYKKDKKKTLGIDF